MMLGSHLRRLRERAGVSRSDAGWAIRASESKISRLELGRVGFKQRDVEDLLSLYGVTETRERERLLELAREANSRGWWHRYGDVTPDWFDAYLGLEAAAELIRTYEIQFVPGLLQTADYARAVARLTPEGARSEDEVERVVALRTRRQRVLDREPPLKLWAVIEESVLLRPIGGRQVLRDQLHALRSAVERPNITVQIIPIDNPGHPAGGGAFTILRFPQRDLPDIVYLEHLTRALYLDKREDVDTYTQTLNLLASTGPPPQQTHHHLTTLLNRLPT
jgi:transcriptional regulator with XRE-family HTH domain